MKVVFRFCIYTLCIVLFSQCKTIEVASSNKHSDWEPLFNGKDIKGWTIKIHHYDVGNNYANTFRVEDGVLKVRYDKYEGDFNERYGHLYYDTPYSYYHLIIEYRFVGDLHPGAPDYTLLNSGVMYHSQNPRTMLKEQDWPISVEMQFLGGIEEGKTRPTGNMCSPGTDIVYNGVIDPNHCVKSTSKTYYGDEWVKAELIVRGDSLITHIINGKKVLEYSKPQIGGGIVNRYDPQLKIDGKLLNSGFIALQSEGQPIDFRNVVLKNLKGCMDPKAKNYKEYYIKNDAEACSY